MVGSRAFYARLQVDLAGWAKAAIAANRGYNPLVQDIAGILASCACSRGCNPFVRSVAGLTKAAFAANRGGNPLVHVFAPVVRGSC